MNHKPLKARVIRKDGTDQSLAWNISDFEFDPANKMIHMFHDKGEVIHHFAPGDTVQMLEQFTGSEED